MEKIFLKDWRFLLKNDSSKSFTGPDLWARDYDDSAWTSVHVPHDWAVRYPFSRENSSGTGYLCGGTAWYRCSFTLGENAADETVRLYFEGVYKHCKVWCNGYYLGSWMNGYTSFSFDISEAVKRDGSENIIAVQVNHEDIADSRWYTGSGIMRPVYIKTSGKAHICPDGEGVYFRNVSPEEFALTVKCRAGNSLGRDEKLKVKVSLYDAENKSVYEAEKNLSFAKTASDSVDDDCDENEALAEFNSKLSGAKLWSCESPYLYTLEARIVGNETVIDSEKMRVGFCKTEFDADRGFFCNGKSYKLKGVCVHEDSGVLGNVINYDVWKRRLEKLKAAGCNAIRMSHNPHSPVLYDLCDEMGFFVFDEIYDEWANAKNKWVTGHNVYPPSHQGIYEDFYSCYRKDVRSFVCRNRSRPSIVLWSIGNEIDYPNDPYCSPKFKEMTGNNDASKPMAERLYNPNHPDIGQLARLAKILSREVKLHDLVRPVTMALAFPELSEDTGVYESLDVVGFNYKEQFYDENHKKYPKKPFTGSENSHSLEAWKYVRDNEYISGQFLWTGIDYLGEAKGWPVHGAPAGLLDMAGFEKPSFYFRKSLWSDEPFVKVYVSPHGKNLWSEKWNYAEGTELDVCVFTGAESADVYVNQKLVKSVQKNEEGMILCTVSYERGFVKAQTADGKEDSIFTCGAACSLEAVHVPAAKNSASGNDSLEQIEIYALDSLGRHVPDESKISVTVEGSGVLEGIENGDVADLTEYTASYRHLAAGRAIIYVRRTCAGEINVSVCGEGKECSVRI